jgi:hypothetical protein
LSQTYLSAVDAERGLQEDGGLGFQQHPVDTEHSLIEWLEVNRLVNDTWHPHKVGHGKDARDLNRKKIEVKIIVYSRSLLIEI